MSKLLCQTQRKNWREVQFSSLFEKFFGAEWGLSHMVSTRHILASITLSHVVYIFRRLELKPSPLTPTLSLSFFSFQIRAFKNTMDGSNASSEHHVIPTQHWIFFRFDGIHTRKNLSTHLHFSLSIFWGKTHIACICKSCGLCFNELDTLCPNKQTNFRQSTWIFQKWYSF